MVRNDPPSPGDPWKRLRLWMLLVAFSGASLLAVLGLAEGVLRLIRPEDRFFPYLPNTTQYNYPSETITPGVRGVSRFTTNSFGTRGPEPHGERVRVLTIGGSTTACTVLDDDEAWPALLMSYLNRDAGDPGFVWVTNSGVDGHNTQHHIIYAKHLLPRLPKIHYVIILAGLNDVGAWLYSERFDPHYLDNPDHWRHRVAQAFKVSNYTPDYRPWYEHLELWKRVSIAKNVLASRLEGKTRRDGAFVEDAELKWMEEARAMRAKQMRQMVPRGKMETLPEALQSYRDNLAWIVRLVRDAGAEPVLVAQAIQQEFVDESERQRLWMGAMDGGKSYVKVEQLIELVDAFNRSMREVAAREGVTIVDLPDLIGGSHDLFYDGIHFNEKGARVMATTLADNLRPILREPPRPRRPAAPASIPGSSKQP